MGSIFAELQMISANQMNTVVDTRKKMNELLHGFLAQEDREEWCDVFARDVRNLETKTMLDCDSFMINSDCDFSFVKPDLMEDTYGLFHGAYCLYSGRYVYPVKDVKGDVMGWCGYDKYSDVKYLDSICYGYKAKNASVWGMEKMPEYYTSGRQVFFTEGIVCALYARQCGEQALATLGSGLTPYVAEIINRFGDKARVLTDSDESGNKFRRITNRMCPRARVIQSKIAKDLDDSKKVNPEVGNDLRNFESRFYVSPYFV